MSGLLKIAIPTVVGTGAVGVGGYYFLSDGENVGSALNRSVKRPRKVLHFKSDVEWREWKEVYGAATSKKIDGVSKEDLAGWCENTLKSSNSDKEIYDLAFKWCVVNTNTFQAELSSKGISVLTVASSDEKWQKAWKHHNSKKSTGGNSVITDEAVVGSSISESNGKRADA